MKEEEIMEGVCWVFINGMDKPAAIGRGDATEEGNDLVLRSKDGSLIGRVALADLRGWWVTHGDDPA